MVVQNFLPTIKLIKKIKSLTIKKWIKIRPWKKVDCIFQYFIFIHFWTHLISPWTFTQEQNLTVIKIVICLLKYVELIILYFHFLLNFCFSFLCDSQKHVDCGDFFRIWEVFWNGTLTELLENLRLSLEFSTIFRILKNLKHFKNLEF